MELTLKPTDLSMPRSKEIVVGFWIVTALLCLQIGFTAYAQLRLPQVADGEQSPFQGWYVWNF
jgi:hypothetical protein